MTDFFHGTPKENVESIARIGIHMNQYFSRYKIRAIREGFSKFSQLRGSPSLTSAERARIMKEDVVVFRVRPGTKTHEMLNDIERLSGTDHGWIETEDDREEKNIFLRVPVPPADIEIAIMEAGDIKIAEERNSTIKSPPV